MPCFPAHDHPAGLPPSVLRRPFLAAAALLAAGAAFAAPSIVRVEGGEGAWRLTVDRKPFVVKGAGGGGDKLLLAALGANSFRTWGSDNARKDLDIAQRTGLKATIGHWLHSTSYFSYEDPAKNAEQTETILARVRENKDHPALLMWAIGNEMEAAKPTSRALWTYVNDLAGKIKEIDPNHPVMTVLMEMSPDKVRLVNELCPNLDIVGFNSYAGAGSLPRRLKEAGLKKPYIVTEYGPPLHNDHNKWWIGVTDFGCPMELSSTQKAKWYVEPSLNALADKGNCLGLYAFTWGFKVESTPTWFGLQLPDGTLTGSALALSEKVWGGHPKNHAPVLDTISEIYDAKLAQAKKENQPKDKLDELAGIWPAMRLSTEKPAAGAEVEAEVRASDPDGDRLEFVWTLFSENANYGVMDTGLAMPRGIEGAIVAGQGSPKARVVLPGGGKYRLYCYVFDLDGAGKRKGAVAYANRPLLGAGAPPKLALPPSKLPFAVYKDGASTPYVPSGYMGSDPSKLSVDEKCSDNPHSGATCLKVKWSAPDGWGALNWQSPANDWGDAPGGANLAGAKFLQFWARGYLGDEKVSFHLGGIGKDRPYPDSGKAERKDLVLTDQWKRYRINLEGVDLSCIKTGFGFSFGGEGSVKTFFLDDIEYVAE